MFLENVSAGGKCAKCYTTSKLLQSVSLRTTTWKNRYFHMEEDEKCTIILYNKTITTPEFDNRISTKSPNSLYLIDEYADNLNADDEKFQLSSAEKLKDILSI